MDELDVRIKYIMARGYIKKLFSGLVLIALTGFCLFIWSLKAGPLSQKSLVKRYETHNLKALQASKLVTLTTFPETDITYEEPWREVAGFIAPWTPSFPFLDSILSNGPLEGSPFRRQYAVIVGDVVLVMTHRWVDAKNWGLAYNPSHVKIPKPYWNKPLIGSWYVWHLHYSATPERAGIWYE